MGPADGLAVGSTLGAREGAMVGVLELWGWWWWVVGVGGGLHGRSRREQVSKVRRSE